MNLLNLEISTNRLLLQPLSMKYKEDVFWEFTLEITTYMYPCPAQDISETEVFIQEVIEDLADGIALGLVILKKESQEFLGCASLHDLTRPKPELGIWLKKTAHGHKYGLEAITALKNWADENLYYQALLYPVDRVNIPSRKIPEALGGKIVREYNKLNMRGKNLNVLEYHIDNLKNQPGEKLLKLGETKIN